MITQDAVRNVLIGDNPFNGMDQLVRTEMAAGRKVLHIFDDLNQSVDEILDTPGLTEDGQEAFLGTLDALTDGCHPKCRYIDTPNVPSPSEAEIVR